MAECIFCKIINRELPSEIIYEDTEFIVIKDIKPLARLHLLIFPKEHILSINDLDDKHKELIGNMVLLAKKIAKDKGVKDSGYRLIFNTGADAGQTVKHLHLHLLGGEKLPFA
jgi:histidine triad (HIT) family protein